MCLRARSYSAFHIIPLKLVLSCSCDILPSQDIGDFEAFLKTERRCRAGVKKELVGLQTEADWDEIDLTTPFPAFQEPEPQTETQKYDYFNAIAIPPKAKFNRFKFDNDEFGTGSTSSPITRVSPFHHPNPSKTITKLAPSPSLGLPKTPFNRVDSGLPIDPEEFAIDVVKLSPQEEELSNFQIQIPSPVPIEPQPPRDLTPKSIEKLRQSFKHFVDSTKPRTSFAFSSKTRSRTATNASTVSPASSKQTSITESSSPVRTKLPSPPLIPYTKQPLQSPSKYTSFPPTIVHYSENPFHETWIMDKTWLCISTTDSILSTPESLFAKAQYQAGLLATDAALSTPSPTASSFTSVPLTSSNSSPPPSTSATSVLASSKDASPSVPIYGALTTPATVSKAQKINLHLLRSCALLACQQPIRALQAADIALKHAEDHGIAYMVSKSHLYRGLALIALKRWAEACTELEQAGGVRGWGLKMGKLIDECLVQELEEKGFENVCLRSGSIYGDANEEILEQEEEDMTQILDQDILWGVWPGDEK